MKCFVFTSFVLVLLTVIAEARIGETLDQIRARYGEGQKGGPRIPGTEKFEFKKDGYTIDVSFFDGISVMEFFHRHDTKITDDDIKDLLKNYIEGVRFTWSARDKIFKSSNKKLTAGRQIGHDDWFFVKDTAAIEALGGEGKAKGL